jgi:hypothetical protein
MKNKLAFGALLLAVFIFGYAISGRVHAQTLPVNFEVATAGSTLANCGPVPALPARCLVATGNYYTQVGSTSWLLVGSSVAVAPTLTIDGITKTLPASFTVAGGTVTVQ